MPEGLDKIDHRVLTAIYRNFNGGPVGLETLAATINEDSGTIEDVASLICAKRILEPHTKGQGLHSSGLQPFGYSGTILCFAGDGHVMGG